MSFECHTLVRHIADVGPTARIVVAKVEGSAPREVGTAMLVWAEGQSGTIGGGALEYEAVKRARAVLLTQSDRIDREPLGPSLGQCCGGSVTLLTEIWDTDRVANVSGKLVARPVPGGPEAPSLKTQRAIANVRNSNEISAQLVDGWMIEPVREPAREVWIYGAGHVGRALVGLLSVLPEISVTWIDTAADRFPETLPEGVTQLIASDPADLVAYAPQSAEHIIVTYSHALDLELCHRLLTHGFKTCGLIGSKTKWTRFKSRLAALGNSSASISSIKCPIGRPDLGKHPQSIAIGVAHDILTSADRRATQRGMVG